MESFYITLPSTASDNLFPNTQSHFRVQLPRALNLEGKWQVGLCEIHVPTAFNNVDDSSNRFNVRLLPETYSLMHTYKVPGFSFTGKGVKTLFEAVKHVFNAVPPDQVKFAQLTLADIHNNLQGKTTSKFEMELSPTLKKLLVTESENQKVHTFAHSGEDLSISIGVLQFDRGPENYDLSIPEGLYTRVDQVTAAMTQVMPTKFQKEISFIPNRDGTLTIKCGKNVTLEFPKRTHGLGSLLGFADEQIILQDVSVGKYPIDLKRGVHGLYVYTDIIEPHIVGNSISPLLRVIPVENEERYSYVKTYTSPDFFNLLTHRIGTIEIDIRTDSGSRPVFRHGKTLIKLLFRKL